jgi:hypothetical protein
VSDEEVNFGITHNDHMGTEFWRRDAVHRVETGTVPNFLPPELTPDERDYMDRPSRTVSLVSVAILLGVVDVICLVTLIFGS